MKSGFTQIAAIAFSVILAGLFCGGCSSDPNSGYSFAPRFDSGISTVAVPLFTRGTNEYRRGIEAPLTEAVIKRIELESPYKVVDRSRADSIIEGTIASVSTKVLSFDPNRNTPRQSEVTVTVSYIWKDLRNGQIITENKTISASGAYIDLGSEQFSAGFHLAINKIANKIVNDMELPW